MYHMSSIDWTVLFAKDESEAEVKVLITYDNLSHDKRLLILNMMIIKAVENHETMKLTLYDA